MGVGGLAGPRVPVRDLDFAFLVDEDVVGADVTDFRKDRDHIFLGTGQRVE